MALAETALDDAPAATVQALPLDTILCGDALDVLRTLPDNSIDAIVTDPPAGIFFMSKKWDSDHGGRDKWIAAFAAIYRECLRVVKPGGHALVWALPRTSHWTAMALEDAGWEVRDRIAAIFGSGFPKSLDVSKQLDKMAGAKREVVTTIRKTPYSTPNTHEGWKRPSHHTDASPDERNRMAITAPATDAARTWDGWGTALKPSVEDWWLCRKPLSEPSVAANILRWGVGALNIGATRVESGACEPNARKTKVPVGADYSELIYHGGWAGNGRGWTGESGRFPSHLLLTHSLFCAPDGSACHESCPIRLLDAQSGILKTGNRRANIPAKGERGYSGGWGADPNAHVGDTGGASRYFQQFHYCAKASRRERNRGCEGLPEKAASAWGSIQEFSSNPPRANHHPTVKPLALMSWLITLITPPGGVVLDCFAGSGSTLVAAKAGGWHYIGVEREQEYVSIARARIAAS